MNSSADYFPLTFGPNAQYNAETWTDAHQEAFDRGVRAAECGQAPLLPIVGAGATPHLVSVRNAWRQGFFAVTPR